MPTKKPKQDEKPQRERFIETAREIGADGTLEAFERAIEKIIGLQPPAEFQNSVPSKDFVGDPSLSLKSYRRKSS